MGNLLSILLRRKTEFKSETPDLKIPKVPLVDYIFNSEGFQAAAKENKVALQCAQTGKQVTFSELRQRARAVGAGLARRGFRAGDVLAIFSPNIVEYPELFFGVIAIGGTCTTVNPTYTATELAHQLRDSKATYLFTLPMFAQTAQEAVAGAAGQVKETFVLGEAPFGCTAFSEVTAQGDAGFPEAVPVDPCRDVVVLPYSSGTTGLSKGVMLTHYNLVAQICQLSSAVDYTSADVGIAVLPFFHIYGMVVLMMMNLCHGMKLISFMKFDPTLFLQKVAEEKVTIAHLAPPLVQFLAKHPAVKAEGLASIREVISGAAPLSHNLYSQLREKIPGGKCVLRQGYGMTELSPASHMTPYGPRGQLHLGSVGTLLPNCTARIVDPSGKCLGAGEEGEVCVRGPNVMKGYLNNAAATAACIKGGFMHTGDVGRVDEEGRLFIVDRVKELIKVKGFQVAPAELEGVLVKSERIADAAVVGFPAELLGGREGDGELPKAFVVLKQPGSMTEAEVMAFVAKDLAEYKHLKAVEFIEAVPKSASGKILRRELKAKGMASAPK